MGASTGRSDSTRGVRAVIAKIWDASGENFLGLRRRVSENSLGRHLTRFHDQIAFESGGATTQRR